MRILYQCFIAAILVSIIQSEEFATTDLNDWYKLIFIYSKMNNNLTQDIVPISYKVKLNTDFENDYVKLDGNAQINMNVINSTKVITLRARNIIIKPDAYLKCSYPIIEPIISTIEPIDNKTELFKIILSNKLDVGSNCNLTFNYTRDNITSSTFMTQFTGQLADETWILATQNFACDVIPCPLDRTLKVSFAISIEHGKNYTALSHMDAMKVETDSKNPERAITHFAESPKIYPNQLAFLIGNFIKDDHNEKFQVFTTRNSSSDPNYVQEIGTKIMNALSNYTGVPYETFGLKTLKTIMGLPIPVGGIAYYGYTLTDTPDYVKIFENSNFDSQTVTNIQTMAHEMTHEWFMSIVYRSPVENDWFLEGIPEYLSFVAVDQAQPTWRMMDQFVIYNYQYNAFQNDYSTDYLAYKDANTAKNWGLIYTKASSIIRMISFILGEENFKIALRNFIETKTPGVITNGVLFKELSKVYTRNINLTDALYNWIYLPGYPVINVKRDYDTGKAIITQSRFLIDRNQTSDEKYWIPINFVTEENLNFMDTNVTHWFDPSQNSIEIDQLKKDQFVIFNKQQFGYYRVNYDIQNWKLIINYLNSKNYSRIHVLNRAQLIDDACSLGKAGQLDYKVVLSLLAYLKQESDPIPWAVAYEHMEEMYNFVKDTKIDKYFKKYISELTEKLEEEISGQLNDTVLIMRGTKKIILDWARSIKPISAEPESTKKLINWLDDPEKNPLPEEKKLHIMCEALEHASQELWEKVWDQYNITNDSDLIYPLLCNKNITISRQYLLRIIPNNVSRDQLISIFDDLIIRSKYADSDVGITLVIDYIIERHNKTTDLSDTLNYYLHDSWEDIMYMIFDERQLNELKTFIKANKASIMEADKKIEDIENKLKSSVKLLHEMTEFFEKNMTIDFKYSNSRPTTVDSKNNSNMNSSTFIYLLFQMIIIKPIFYFNQLIY